jgi:arylsulfatase
MGRLSENSVVSIKNKSFSVTAEVDVPDGGAEGVIIAQGGRFGNVTLYHDGNEVATGRVEATQPTILSADETTDIGYESGTPVGSDYTTETSRFTGKINWIQLDVGADDHDHYIDTDERFRIAMARQ